MEMVFNFTNFYVTVFYFISILKLGLIATWLKSVRTPRVAAGTSLGKLGQMEVQIKSK
jgi:hypothetical protein